MKTIGKILMALPLITAFTSCEAQPKNAKTITVKIYGNCEMCESNIEDAAYRKKVASADWNPNTKMATLRFEATQTNEDEILKRIAYAGYDNEKYLAPDDVYAKLPACCRYERTAKKVMKQSNTTAHKGEHENHATNDSTMYKEQKEVNQLQAVYDAYFDLKNALVKSDAKTAADNAEKLVKAVEKADMGKMKTAQHNTWMKVYKSINENATAISTTGDLKKQRQTFAKLSENMITLLDDAALDKPVYQQHCPMYNGGADWLSTENEVKNPFYGAQMLTCGKTVKTIK